MTDFDLHGIVGIRLVDAEPRDTAAVRRQLGPIEASLDREPDIVCRFVERLSRSSRMRLIGLNDAGFTDDAYIVLRSRQKASTLVQIPMADIGGRCELVCEHGAPAIPLLIAIVNLTALAKGYVPIHASAAIHRGLGTLIAGWAKGGKTELLLGLMAHGATYVGDEWVYLAPDGREMLGIPEPMKVWGTHLAAMPSYRDRISRADRVRIGALAGGARLGHGLASIGRRSSVGRLARRASFVADQQTYVHVPPTRLFGEDRCRLRGPLDRIVLAVSAEGNEVHTEPMTAAEVAARMSASVHHERLDLIAHYLKFRYAFPEARNSHIEQADARQRELLTAALGTKPAARLIHPYPAPIQPMFAEVDAWLR